MARPDFRGHSLGRKIEVVLLRLLLKLLLRLEVVGLENVPATGPVVGIINHIAFLDPVVSCGILPRPVVPIAKREAFDTFFVGSLIKIYGTIPIQRGEADLTALKAALRVLKSDGFVLLAPEGTRSPTRQLQKGKAGAVLLALRSRAAIVPIAVTGTHHMKENWRRLKRSPVRVVIGQPFYLRSAANGRVSRSELTAMMEETMYRLAALLPEEHRGVYRDLEQATAKHLRLA